VRKITEENVVKQIVYRNEKAIPSDYQEILTTPTKSRAGRET